MFLYRPLDWLCFARNVSLLLLSRTFFNVDKLFLSFLVLTCLTFNDMYILLVSDFNIFVSNSSKLM